MAATLRSYPAPRLPLESFLARYGQGKRRDRVAPRYQAMLAEAERLAAPATIHLEAGVSQVASLSPWLTPEAVSVVLAVLTLGEPLDDEISRLSNNGELAWAVVLDEVAVAMIRALTRELHAAIRAEAAGRGLKAGPAFRPGLGRWPIETQREVFAHLPAHEIGVRMNSHLVMQPPKSVSLIIPLLPLRDVHKKPEMA
jgi:hypothetical protein